LLSLKLVGASRRGQSKTLPRGCALQRYRGA
jgi:hypothetical protein